MDYMDYVDDASAGLLFLAAVARALGARPARRRNLPGKLAGADRPPRADCGHVGA